MERRHQVFISSTYSDLKSERAEVTQALLELDCFPAGMELFPATTVGAWDLIRGVIDDSDYYCLIIGGRYGSLDADGISYTEKEYNYAVEASKPLMVFVHKDLDLIQSGKAEKSEEGRKKLEAFKAKVEASHHCKYWVNAGELGGLVSRGLVNLRKAHPSEGWVPGRFAATGELMLEVANLRAKLAELTAQTANKTGSTNTKVIDGLASGLDVYSPHVSFSVVGKKDIRTESISTTWVNILKYVGPALINECSDAEFRDKLELCFYHRIEHELGLDVKHDSVIIPHVVVDQIKVQMRALGQMIPGEKRRAVADKMNYWKLTALGEEQLVSAQAIPKVRTTLPPLVDALRGYASTSDSGKASDVAPDGSDPV